MTERIRIGTRSSPLALRQADMVREALKAAHPGLAVEIVTITTSGDWRPEHGETRLSEKEGGKGLFAREIERALLDGEVDCGVHSLKDMDSVLPEGLVIDHVLPREDARDALLTNGSRSLRDLPQGARVGTASLRRQAMLLALRPDLRIEPLRGNVRTRIDKLRAGQVDATLLALAGLRRLGIADEAACVLEPGEFLPAAAQGIVGIETRRNDPRTRLLLDAIHCARTGLMAAAERAVLRTLDGSCRTPIGAYAEMDNGTMHLRALVASPDGRQVFRHEACGTIAVPAEAEALGAAAGADLKVRIPPEILS